MQVCEQLILKADTVSNVSQTTVQQLGPNLGGQQSSTDAPNVPKVLPCNTVLSQTPQTSNLNTNVQAAPVLSSVNTNSGNALARSATAPAATAGSGPVGPATAGTPPSEVIALPSWASTTANAVTARLNSTAPFDIEGRYLVKPAFLKVLRAVEGVNQSQVVFPYREVFIHIDRFCSLFCCPHYRFNITTG
jgi:hypothetical protein